MAQSDRTGRPFDLMSLFDNPFLVAGGQIRLQNGHVARHHLLKHRETIVDKLRSHQLDILLQHIGIQHRVGFMQIGRRRFLRFLIRCIPEFLDHGRQRWHR
ncbi:Uncharacterised protein [Klebsiella pneumoniae]|nr:Uncharacterised protein [Klebsiella pneumoniae]